MSALEKEFVYWKELWGGTYEEYMSVPFSRRKRFIEEKDRIEVERRRAASHNSSGFRRKR